MSDGKNTPIWKKEISFRRKPEAAAPDGEAGSTPLWKKEVSFRKKSEAGRRSRRPPRCRPTL